MTNTNTKTTFRPELSFEPAQMNQRHDNRFEILKRVIWCGKPIGWVEKNKVTKSFHFQPGQDSPSGHEPYQFSSNSFELLASWMTRYYLNNYRKEAADYRESHKAAV